MVVTQRLPFALAAQQEKALLPDPLIASGPLILMVDDDAALRMLFERYLTLFGYTTLFAASGEEALRIALARQEIRLIILDVIMPGLSGQELAQQLTALLPEAALLFSSGHPVSALIRLGIDIQGAQFMQKPCRPLELKQRLSEMLPIRKLPTQPTSSLQSSR